ncbi:MAG TPA: DNA phosphorothioation-associated putative methyltransferase [Planctomycetaceae bacterium]
MLPDIKEFFGTYKQVRDQADELLFRAGDADAVDEACRNSSLGKLLPNALYIHRSALEELGPLLRVYEGCARAYLGQIEDANLIKLHRFSGKISYLAYPDFETDPHPALATCVKLNMRSRQIDFYDYRQSANPPVLHRKETFLAASHPCSLASPASPGRKSGTACLTTRRRSAPAPAGTPASERQVSVWQVIDCCVENCRSTPDKSGSRTSR